jgi:erythromycin esterase
MAEANQLKARMVRFLHEQLGFSVIAFESSLYLAHQADEKAATATPRSTLTSSLIGVWHTQEVLPLFEAIRASRATARPLRLAGFDVQPIGSGKKSRPGFYRRLISAVDEKYAAEAEVFDAAFIVEYDKGSSARRTYFRANRDALVDGYTRLASFLDRHRPAVEKSAGREATLVAAQEARSMAMYVRQQTAADNQAYAELRDEGMADNVRFLEELFPDQKIIIWAHNYHVMHDAAGAEASPDVFPGVPARSMGSWTRQRLADRVYTVGIYAAEGRAADNSRTEYIIERPAADSLEGRLGAQATNGPAVFLDVAAALKGGAAWLQSPVLARFEGRSGQRLVPASQYDGLIVVTRVSPPVFLY